MKNNKGYTLAELLISITIFAIAMVSIMAVMSNAIKAYSNANLDVSVQENAQLVANQVEELLCDAENISGSGPYTFKKNSVEYQLALSGNDLVLKEVASGTDYTLAKNVDSFSIDSYNASTNFGGVAGHTNTVKAFNEASFSIGFDDNHGTTYDLTRNIFFRNEVEDNKFHGIEYTSANISSGGGGGSTAVKNINVKRYQTYNLTTENEIKYDCKLCKEVAAYTPGCYTLDGKFYVEDSTPGYFTLTSSNTFPSSSLTDYTGAMTYYLKTGGNLNASTGWLSGPSTIASQFFVCGYSDKAKSNVKVCSLTVDPVEICDTVIQAHYNGQVNGEGFPNPVEIKGINLNDAIKNSVSVKASVEFLGEKTGSSNEITLTSCSGVYELNNYKFDQIDFTGGDRVNMGLVPDPYSGGFFVVFNNEGMQHLGDGGNLQLKVKLNIGGIAKDKTFKVDRLDTNF